MLYYCELLENAIPIAKHLLLKDKMGVKRFFKVNDLLTALIGPYKFLCIMYGYERFQVVVLMMLRRPVLFHIFGKFTYYDRIHRIGYRRNLINYSSKFGWHFTLNLIF